MTPHLSRVVNETTGQVVVVLTHPDEPAVTLRLEGPQGSVKPLAELLAYVLGEWLRKAQAGAR